MEIANSHPEIHSSFILNGALFGACHCYCMAIIRKVGKVTELVSHILWNLTTMALWQAAKATISTLHELGMEDTCLIGGVAAKLYGSDREPHVSVGSDY